jgi:hypothetical protein
MKEKRMITEEYVKDLIAKAIKKAKIEAYSLAINIHAKAFTGASFRVAMFNLLAELEGKEKK